VPTTTDTARGNNPQWLELFRGEVLARGQTRTYRANTQVVQEGEPAESLYWILSGELVAFIEDEDGHVLELSRMRAGEYFGELLFARIARTASVRTATAAKLCRIGRGELETLLTEHPVIALEIIRMLSHRLASLAGTVRGIALTAH
jgi:CRP/FNR family transcriptional regulator, cyclic AMP receptor protein